MKILKYRHAHPYAIHNEVLLFDRLSLRYWKMFSCSVFIGVLFDSESSVDFSLTTKFRILSNEKLFGFCVPRNSKFLYIVTRLPNMNLNFNFDFSSYHNMHMTPLGQYCCVSKIWRKINFPRINKKIYSQFSFTTAHNGWNIWSKR